MFFMVCVLTFPKVNFFKQDDLTRLVGSISLVLVFEHPGHSTSLTISSETNFFNSNSNFTVAYQKNAIH